MVTSLSFLPRVVLAENLLSTGRDCSWRQSLSSYDELLHQLLYLSYEATLACSTVCAATNWKLLS